MSVAICSGPTVKGIFSDAVVTSGFPTVSDNGSITVFTEAFAPSFVHGVSVEAEIPLGLLISDGQTVTVNQAAYASALVAAITAKLQALGAYGLAREQAGVTVGGFLYDTDDATQAKLGNAYQLAQTAISPDIFSWWMARGWVAIPKAQIISDAPHVAAYVEAVFENIGLHFAAIEALRTLGAVAAYDYSTGWPAGT